MPCVSSAGNQGPGRRPGGSSPRRTAVAAIAQCRIASGGSSAQPTLFPACWADGGRGTRSLARPIRAAHQDMATAMAKERSAVYSASPADG
eukprot:9553517-Heterocapsa_arctica.AAC.1